MKIVLQRDLTGDEAVKRGFITGAVFDWPRSVITSISQQEGSDDWFRFSTEVERSMRRSSAMNERKLEEASDESSTVADKATSAIRTSRKKAGA
jgi:hypothetical protein